MKADRSQSRKREASAGPKRASPQLAGVEGGRSDAAGDRRLLARSTLETLARAIHIGHVRRQLEQGATSDDTALASWDELPETLRDSNRDQARDIGRKLAAVGYELVPRTDDDSPLFRFTNPEVEYLSRLEHERWCEERLRAGWRLGRIRDVKRKLSPYLVAWESLTEEVRNLDRDAVRHIPALLALAGFTVRRAQLDGPISPRQSLDDLASKPREA